jgi:nitrogenase molybdenum-cofactor synthesis protein NifE
MKNEPFVIPIKELGAAKGHWQRKIMPDDALHYMPPSAGGWGVVRMALQVPESIVLMAAPPVCARIGFLRELRLGYRNRFFLLDLGEQEFIDGRYLGSVRDAVSEVLSRIPVKPKVLFLCETCIDDLIGSDYAGLAGEIERTFGIWVRMIHIKPTAADGKRPSGLVTQLSMYSLLERQGIRDEGFNVIGSMMPIERESEFREVMAGAGIGPVRHAASCATFEEFRMMARSSYNLLLRPAGRLAVEDMKKRLDIPYLRLPSAYGFSVIEESYKALETWLCRKLRTDVYRQEAVDCVESKAKLFKGLSAAVGQSVNTGTFELARALTEYGMRVRYVFTNVVIDFDTEHVEWLKERVPDLLVFANSQIGRASCRERV